MRARTLEWPLLAGALAVLLAQLVYGLRSDGLTNDEVLYISAGWRQLALGDYRLNPTHPPLGPDLAALGLLGLRPQTPPFAQGDDVMAWCYRFVHVANPAGPLIARARMPVVLLTLALAALGWAWARELGGQRAGLLAAGLFAFHPSLIAHGHLASTDLPAGFAMLAASWCFWRWTRAPRLAWAAAVSLALGVAVCTRLTAWILAPCFGLLALMAAWRATSAARAELARKAGLLALTAVLVVPAVIWAAYGFRRQPWPGEPMAGTLAAPSGDLADRALRAAQQQGLLPETYLEGGRFQIEHNRRGHLGYLLGERSRHGWRHYFLVALLVKSTPGFLIALVLAVAASARALRASEGAPSVAHWLVPAASIFAVVSAGHIQIGERYLLPVHAYLVPFIACSLTRWLETPVPAMRAWVAGALLALHALPSLLSVRNGHLAYFNLLAGGTTGGHRVLLDSNLDWGQDLPRLARWMRQRGERSIQLGYAGVDDPDRFGIARDDLPGQHLHPERSASAALTGTVVVSPNLVYGLVPRLAPFYEPLRQRPPDERAGVFFVYRIPGPSRAASVPPLEIQAP